MAIISLSPPRVNDVLIETASEKLELSQKKSKYQNNSNHPNDLSSCSALPSSAGQIKKSKNILSLAPFFKSTLSFQQSADATFPLFCMSSKTKADENTFFHQNLFYYHD